jgi:hypothetical protein
MSDPVCVLLFEDDEKHASAASERLAKIAKSNNQFRIVWFDGPFSKPTSGMKADVPFPIQHPSKIIDVSPGRLVEKTVGNEEWWQRDFDVAILDILDKKSGESTGYDFAAWLDRAKHRGEVIIVSGGSANSDTLPDLNLRFVPKRGNWIQKTIDLLPSEKVAEPRVNCQGRPWQTLISDFFRATGSERKWVGAYFGSDIDLSRKIHTFFSVGSFDGEYLHDLDSIEAALGGTRAKPNILSVDVADGHLDDDLVTKTKGAIGLNPIVALFFSDKSAIDESETFSTLNATLVNRQTFDKCPSIWAYDAVARLTARYAGYQKTLERQREKRPRGKFAKGNSSPPQQIVWTEEVLREGLKLFQSTHGAFALGRSMDKVTSNTPSLVSWVKGDIERSLKTSFTSKMSELVVGLRSKGKITADQARLYVHE